MAYYEEGLLDLTPTGYPIPWLPRARTLETDGRPVVNLRLDGLRMPSRRVRPMPEMAVDLIAPDNGTDEEPGPNHDAIEDYLYGVRNSSSLSPDERALLAEASPDTLHMAGEHYHFTGINPSESNQDDEPVTPVREQDAPFFLNHRVYAFSRVGAASTTDDARR